MASNISNYNISKTFANVILTNVEDSDDLDGVPSISIPAQRSCNESLRDQGRLQDGLGNEIPMVLGKNLIEVEATPISAFSVIRRCDLMAVSAYQHIQSLIWS